MNNNRMSRVDSEIQKALAAIIGKLDDSEITSTLVSINFNLSVYIGNNSFILHLFYR